MELTLVLLVVAVALAFEYINGFHDTANSIATVVATKVLSPGQAVLLAAATNLIGALAGTAVAKTIGQPFLIQAAASSSLSCARYSMTTAQRSWESPGYTARAQPCMRRRLLLLSVDLDSEFIV